jgi:hypothetical protein
MDIDCSANISYNMNPQYRLINSNITGLKDDSNYGTMKIMMIMMILTDQHDCIVSTSLCDSIFDKLCIAKDKFFSVINLSDLKILRIKIIIIIIIIVIIMMKLMMKILIHTLRL